jgi:hypothetical protein
MPDIGVILRSVRGLECYKAAWLPYHDHGSGIMICAWQTEPTTSRPDRVEDLDVIV